VLGKTIAKQERAVIWLLPANAAGAYWQGLVGLVLMLDINLQDTLHWSIIQRGNFWLISCTSYQQ